MAAAVVQAAGCALEEEDLPTWCRQRMSAYKVPRLFRIVASLPRNAMGKTTKLEVRKFFA